MQTHNVVQVRIAEDKSQKRYTYNVPENVVLSKGDIVCVQNHNGRKTIAICVTDSEYLSDNDIDMIMNDSQVISNVIGKYQLRLYVEN